MSLLCTALGGPHCSTPRHLSHPWGAPPEVVTPQTPTMGCNSPRGAPAASLPSEEGATFAGALHAGGHCGDGRSRSRPWLSPTPAVWRRRDVLKPRPGLLPGSAHPPRRCPRQPWSAAGDGVMPLGQSPPSAPGQPRSRAKVSPAAGYCRAPCRNLPGHRLLGVSHR